MRTQYIICLIGLCLSNFIVNAQVAFYNSGVLKISSISDSFTLKGDFINASTSLFENEGNMYVQSNLSNAQTTDLTGAGTIIIVGTTDQNLSGTGAWKNITIDKGVGNVILASDATVKGQLTFTSGKIQTGSNTLIISGAGILAGAAQNTGWVNGKLQKTLPTGAVTRAFEVGDATIYAPVSLVFPNITTSGNITASTIGTEHPNNVTSIINPAKSVNRYWTITNGGTAFNSYTATFNFAATDIDAGALTSNFAVGLYNGGWSMLSTSMRNATNTRAAGFTTMGSYAIGESFTVVPVTFTAITAARQQRNILVDWQTENETGVLKYEVERSGNGIAFTSVNTTPVNGSASYRFVDKEPLAGDNFYRIRSLSNNGGHAYSGIANVNMPSKPAIAVYPNAVTGSMTSLQLNNIVKGVYTVGVYNTAGQMVRKQSLQHAGGNAKYILSLEALPAGKYEAVVTGQNVKLVTYLIKE